MKERPVVIITGASRGIGAWVARWLGKIGARMTLIARTGPLLDQISAEIGSLGGDALPLPGDLSLNPHTLHL